MKPPWLTTEFWVTCAAGLIAILIAFGVIGKTTGEEAVSYVQEIAGAVLAVIAALGYGNGRQKLRSTYVSATAEIYAAKKPEIEIVETKERKLGWIKLKRIKRINSFEKILRDMGV